MKNKNILNGVFLGLLLILVVLNLSFFNRESNALQSRSDYSENGVYVHFVDVGQGDAIIIQSDEYAVLIDAGPSNASNALVSYIDNLNITRFNLAIFTHPHSDHIGGGAAILKRFGAGEVWLPDVIHSTATFERLLDAIESFYIPEIGDALLFNGASISVVHADHSAEEINNASLVLRLEYGETSFLFTGDMEASAETKALANGVELRSDVLKIAHHGSRTSSAEAFLNAVRPSIAVISVGIDNRYGHPHSAVIERLKARRIQILRLDELGTVVLFSDGMNIFLE